MTMNLYLHFRLALHSVKRLYKAGGSQTLPYKAQVILILMTALLSLGMLPAQAQGDCGIVRSINFPVSPEQFHIMQDFGAPSVRYQGRYHTGEDYYGGRGTSYGQPVSAIADGRVTYSAPTGWGRDGGVVIIQHTFPDNSIAYSLYGHLESSDAHPFPQKFACVKAGDIVGTVGDVRPAPHVHLEIRTNNPDTPGAGYSIEPPTEIGDLQPTKFILDWQAWLSPAHKWHLQLPNDQRPVAPPLLLNDGSMLIMTSDRIRFSSVDGRILKRLILPQFAVGLTGFQGNAVVIYADGSMQIINLDATLGEFWNTRTPLDSAPLTIGDLLVFHTPDNALVAIGADRRAVAWRIENIPPFVQASVSPNVIGLLTDDNSLITVSSQGKLLTTTPLPDAPFMTSAQDGNLLVYSQNTLSEVDASGTWTKVGEYPSGDSSRSALLTGTDGKRYFLAGGASPNLTATDFQGNTIWQLNLPDVTGQAQLIAQDKALVLLTSGGDLIAFQAATGVMCSQLHIYGDRRSRLWVDLSGGLLRVGLADQILGLDWKAFAGNCG
jgi:murein DD-endopeptidase MepM/ murein hydrolase activator NlpD